MNAIEQIKKKQFSVTFDTKTQDAIESIRCFEHENIELSYNQAINLLIKEALAQRGKQS